MSEAARAMDRMYRRQRHIYDASRKFYLLECDAVIAELAPPTGGSVLGMGSGTGRNLIAIAKAYLGAACHGLDVSAAMLETASGAVARAGLAGPIRLAQGDATDFDPEALFGRAAFDRIVISYALSMIPPWQGVLREAAGHLAPSGALHVVDFSDQAELPGPFRALLNRWFAAFQVTPRGDLPAVSSEVATASGLRASVRQRFRGYAVHGLIKRAATSG